MIAEHFAKHSARGIHRAARVRRPCALQFAAGALVLLLATAAPAAQASEAPVKMSGSAICHEPGSRFYDQTVRFQPYADLDACLRAGGRLPRGVKPRGSEQSSAPVAATGANASVQRGAAEPPAEPRAEAVLRPGATSTSHDIGAPIAVEPGDRSHAAMPWVSLGAGTVMLGGLIWWAVQVRSARRRRAQEDADRRHWQDHRLSRYDRADEAKLLLAVRGDRAVFDRLVDYELSRNPQVAREQAISDAYARWQRDNG
jgi:hypothetical protein